MHLTYCIILSFVCMTLYAYYHYSHTQTHSHTHPLTPSPPLSSAPACCHSDCSSSSTLSYVAGAYADSSSNQIAELFFASPEGGLLVQPASPSGCGGAGLDGRLQPWFTGVTRENPIEVVIMLDVFRSAAVSNNSLYGELVNSVSTVLRSLNNGDRVRRERCEFC